MRTQILATNALLGALTGGIRARIAKKPVLRGMVRGASGGAVASAGRQIVGTRRAAAGITGRLVHDIGLGLGSTAVRDTFEMPFHLGPIVARWIPSRRQWPRVRVNIANLVVAAAIRQEPGVTLDWAETFWSGSVVLGERRYNGSFSDALPRAGPGSVWLPIGSYVGFPEQEVRAERRLVVAHEAIHVLQLDASHEWIGHDIESAVLRRSRIGRAIGRWVEPGVLGPVAAQIVTSPFAYENRWLEREAFWLSEGRSVRGTR